MLRTIGAEQAPFHRTYITGPTALCADHPGRSKPFWHSMGSPDVWKIAGQNYPDTSCFFGEREIIDISEYLALLGIQTNITRCASYERATFDMLYYHIEQNRRIVPNIQASDINDVVDFDRVREWIDTLAQAGTLKSGQAMQAWLTSGGIWEEVER
mgnify:CR=1 FL=1